ncbi:RIP metalloprotease RseP [uncultured Clostridium sp.]|uniref:RIP metalloprotease RseP n=1 Tax=uncultured Clostridium sp. TaxID=59620 RepID=UPI00261563D8|nr:RIP metalloprotease RseP [uncultured Clostridium sp.]
MYVIFAILAFSSLIIVHELGHFIVAKLNGVKVIEFSIGMGPKLFSINKNDTKYSLGILPIGGYVQMAGEYDEDNNEGNERKDEEGTLNSKSPLQKIAVMIAGVVMNIILAIVIFGAMGSHFGYNTQTINSVEKNSPAYEAGIRQGDTIEKINGSKVIATTDITSEILMSNGNDVNLLIDRNGENLDIKVKPKEIEGSYLIGVTFKSVKNVGIVQSLKHGVNESLSVIKQTYIGIKNLATGKGSFTKDVGGPVTIIKMTGEAAKMGIWPLLNLTAFLSINLAVINFLPIPALDGGRCLMYIFEVITRIKVPTKVENVINTIGFILLMGLMLVVTLKDILFPINL